MHWRPGLPFIAGISPNTTVAVLFQSSSIFTNTVGLHPFSLECLKCVEHKSSCRDVNLVAGKLSSLAYIFFLDFLNVRTLSFLWKTGKNGSASIQQPYFVRDVAVRGAVVAEEVAVIPWSSLISKHKRLLLWTPRTFQAGTTVSRLLWEVQSCGRRTRCSSPGGLTKSRYSQALGSSSSLQQEVSS